MRYDNRLLTATGQLTPEVLAGRVAVVTGAGRGIGFEAARGVLWLGADVVIAEIDRAAGELAAETLRHEFDSDRVLSVQTDVGDEADIEALAGETRSRFGSPDIVVNNAAVRWVR